MRRFCPREEWVCTKSWGSAGNEGTSERHAKAGSEKRWRSSKACRCVRVAPGSKVFWCRLVLLAVTGLGNCGQTSISGEPGEFLPNCLGMQRPILPSLPGFCSPTAHRSLIAALARPRARSSGPRGSIYSAGSRVLSRWFWFSKLAVEPRRCPFEHAALETPRLHQAFVL